jgi:diguanylate cyclase (GGDEF)-like protein
MLAWRSRHPLYVGLAGTAGFCVLCGISYGIFTQAGWVPLIAPALALVATSGSIMAYKQTALQTANQQLTSLVSLDGLTQIANRRRFDEYLSLEWRRMARETAPLSLILCDVDYFKRYNDTYGHQAGDACLQQVAQAISRVLKRPADLAARYGGEEFAVILPNTKAEGAVLVAEAMLKEIQQLLIPHATSSVSEYVTLSVGVSSTVPQKEFSQAALIAAADKALYEAKEQGRNRVILRPLACGETALKEGFPQ